MNTSFKSSSLCPDKEDNCIYVENWEDNEVINQPIKADYSKQFKKIESIDVGVWKIKKRNQK